MSAGDLEALQACAEAELEMLQRFGAQGWRVRSGRLRLGSRAIYVFAVTYAQARSAAQQQWCRELVL